MDPQIPWSYIYHRSLGQWPAAMPAWAGAHCQLHCTAVIPESMTALQRLHQLCDCVKLPRLSALATRLVCMVQCTSSAVFASTGAGTAPQAEHCTSYHQAKYSMSEVFAVWVVCANSRAVRSQTEVLEPLSDRRTTHFGAWTADISKDLASASEVDALNYRRRCCTRCNVES